MAVWPNKLPPCCESAPTLTPTGHSCPERDALAVFVQNNGYQGPDLPKALDQDPPFDPCIDLELLKATARPSNLSMVAVAQGKDSAAEQYYRKAVEACRAGPGLFVWPALQEERRACRFGIQESWVLLGERCLIPGILSRVPKKGFM